MNDFAWLRFWDLNITWMKKQKRNSNEEGYNTKWKSCKNMGRGLSNSVDREYE